MVICRRMSAERSMNEEQQVVALAQRIQELETELAGARAQLIGVHSRLMFARESFYEDRHTETALRSTSVARVGTNGKTAEPPLPIHIEPLPIHHPLRRKWALGKGLQDTQPGDTGQRICFTGKQAPGGKLRLFGLLADGEPWEHIIPFSDLASENGIIIGRDPRSVNLLLPETGVSRSHARIELGSTGLVITDLNSTNGILVNDEHINCYSPQVPLSDGSTIRLGDTILRIEIIYGSTEPPKKRTIS